MFTLKNYEKKEKIIKKIIFGVFASFACILSATLDVRFAGVIKTGLSQKDQPNHSPLLRFGPSVGEKGK